MTTVYLGLGSNIGDSQAILYEAIHEIATKLVNVSTSSIYRSSPRYVSDQPDFFNQVASGQTDMNPFELLGFLQSIEAHFGRDRAREIQKGPRTLDIDILLFGTVRVDTDSLIIPHPGMLERAFVLVPLVELMPSLQHPITNQLFSDCIELVRSQGIYLHAKAPL